MTFHNTTDRQVFLYIGADKTVLNPNDSTEVNCPDRVVITLTHDYKSKAMSEKEIALDDLDASVVSVLISSYKDPYFDIVLDCTYEIEGTQESVIYIRKDVIRPVYACSYDRLYPVVDNGSAKEVSCLFSERKNFEQHYVRAISRGNRKILNIALIILAVSSLPIILICFLAKALIGIIAALIVFAGLCLIRLCGNFICKLLCKVDCSLVFSNFESNKIIDHFRKSDADENASEFKNI